jgi:hypothetical protein
MQLTALPKIEREAIDLLLRDETFAALRRQLAAVAQVKRRESGAGVFVEFEFGTDVERLADMGSLDIDGVFATGTECEEIGFILFVKDGLIDYLEAYVFGNAYPSYEACDYVLSRHDVNRIDNHAVNLNGQTSA